jgi:VCBS repeat-containing protein
LAERTNRSPAFSAASQSVSTNEDTAKAITLAATDADGDPLTYTAAVAANGTVAVSGAIVTYTPKLNYNGPDSFVVTARDGKGSTAIQTVNVTIAALNDAPVMTSGASATVAENASISTVVYTAAATDVDTDDTKTFSLSGTDAALFSIDSANGAVTLKSSANYEAKSSYSINVVATDKGGLTATKAVTVNVTNVNEAPTFSAASQSVSATAGYAKTIALAATDVDGDTLTYTVATPGKGTATISGSTLTYTPTLSASGPDSFVVTASDGKGGTATQTINATIAAVSSFRLAVPDGWTGSVGGNGTIAPTGADSAADAAGARLSLSGGALAPSQTAHVTISGKVTIIGTSSNDIVALDAGKPANLTFDASFNQGGDIIILDKDAASYSAVRSGSSILLTATDETLSIPVGTVGLTLRFTDGDRTMLFAGGAFKIGDQAIGTAATPLKPTVITYIDIGAASISETISGADGSVIFTNDPTKSAFVKITNFGSGDLIRVTGATDYIFTTGDLDGDGTADDLAISLSNADTGIVNDIYILNSVSPEAFVFDRTTAFSAVGFNFITFG